MRKSIIIILNQLNIKNNKIDKDNFEKNHMWKHCSNPHYFKEKNYKTKFSTNSMKKKIERQFWEKNKIKS
jgi:hypothetical protein